MQATATYKIGLPRLSPSSTITTTTLATAAAAAEINDGLTTTESSANKPRNLTTQKTSGLNDDGAFAVIVRPTLPTPEQLPDEYRSYVEYNYFNQQHSDDGNPPETTTTDPTTTSVSDNILSKYQGFL